MVERMRKPVSAFAVAVSMLASSFALALGGIAYTRFAIERERQGSERRQCEIVALELAFYRDFPPDNPRLAARRDYYQRKWIESCS